MPKLLSGSHVQQFRVNSKTGETDLPRSVRNVFFGMKVGDKEIITQTIGHFRKVQTTVVRTSKGGRFTRQITMNNGIVPDKSGEILIF